MTKPVRLQLSRRKGYSVQSATIAANGLPAANVARPGPWGNPFTVAALMEVNPKVTEEQARVFVVECFRDWLDGRNLHWQGPECDRLREQFSANINTLRGKNLACWCKPGEPCHADILLERANPVCEEVTDA